MSRIPESTTLYNGSLCRATRRQYSEAGLHMVYAIMVNVKLGCIIVIIKSNFKINFNEKRIILSHNVPFWAIFPISTPRLHALLELHKNILPTHVEAYTMV